jgi:hypothetical protein
MGFASKSPTGHLTSVSQAKSPKRIVSARLRRREFDVNRRAISLLAEPLGHHPNDLLLPHR